MARVLRRKKISWYVFGAQAVLARGIPRLTADVDVTLFVSSKALGALLDELTASGFASRVEDLKTFAHHSRVLPLFHPSSGMLLDLVLAGDGIERSFLARVERFDLGAGPMPMLSTEDLLITKIIAGRPKDLEDVRSLLRVCAGIDLEYLRRCLSDLDTELERVDLLPAFERLYREGRQSLVK